MDISQEGTVYAERYKVYDFPHIGIIDPRTRRLLWKKEGWTQVNPLTAVQFAEFAMDFCSRHSFDKPPQAPRPSGGSAATGRPSKRPMHEMSEEEQLQAAMRESLKESGGAAAAASMDDDDEDDVEYVMEDGGDDDVQILEDSKPQAEEAKPPAPAAAPSMLAQLLSLDLGDEPANGARIQFRMPDGKKNIRKFDTSKNVRLVYAFVAVSFTIKKI
jgi:hypothetical protein